MMGYEIYEIMTLFGFYAVLGWLFEQLLYGIHGRTVKRGLLKGPFSVLYGIAGLLMLFLFKPFNDGLLYTFCMLFIISIGVDLLALLVIKLSSGIFMWNYSFIYPLIGTFLMIIAIKDINPLLEKLIYVMPIWLQFGLLIVFYIWFISDFVDCIEMLFIYRKKMRNLRALKNGDLSEYAERGYEFLLNYRRWMKAYPKFKKETLKRVFYGFSKEQIIEIKQNIRGYR